MNKSLWIRLVLPLSAVFLLALGAHRLWTADGFFLNLATELVGILITIAYVEWIMEEHDRRRWAAADTRIANRLRILLNGTVSGLRSALQFGTDVMDLRLTLNPDPIAMHKDVLRVGTHVIAPASRSRVEALDENGWARLARNIQNSHAATANFLNAFQARLSPNQIAALLDLQDSLANSLTLYTTFPDVVGVPEDRLPQMRKTDPEVLQQQACDRTASEIQRICHIACTLSESLD